MGQPKLTPLAAAIRAAEPLSDEEKQTLRDILRPAPKPRSKSKPERKPSQRRKVAKDSDDNGNKILPHSMCTCGQPFDANVHHLETWSDYHQFQPAGETSKGVGV